MNSTSEIIKTLRTRCKLSQMEIARQTGIPQPRISRWEHGHGTDSPDEALRLSAFLAARLAAEKRSAAKKNAAAA